MKYMKVYIHKLDSNLKKILIQKIDKNNITNIINITSEPKNEWSN